jgi:hypothetical protein
MADSPRGMGHTDSMESHDDTSKQNDKKKSRRPANTAFRQQRLKAWQPILTPKTVLPLFFTIGIIFAPIGGLLLYANSQVQEIRLDYTDCIQLTASDDFDSMPSDAVETFFRASDYNVNAQWRHQENVNITTHSGLTVLGSQCDIEFDIPEAMGAPVFLYYYLTNFHQNHRRYVASFDTDQLTGSARSYNDLDGSDCDPLYGNSDLQLPYFPCGLIANSLFNDSFTSPRLLNPAGSSGNDTREYTMSTSNIAWSSDRDLYSDTTSYAFDQVLPPPNWQERYPDGRYTEEYPPPNLKEWEAFQVWMRTAGLPTFSKLWSRSTNDTAMEAGRYRITADYFFPVREYEGTKSILITTRTVMGGRNDFLGIAYVVVGGLCIVLGVVFTVTHLIKPRKLGDHTYLSWNNVPGAKNTGTTGIASGREARPGEA